MVTLLLIIIYIAFISLGLPDSILGAAWPTMQADLSLPMSFAGIISMYISGATIVSSVFSGRLIQKLGTSKLTLISVLVTAFALFGFSIGQNYIWFCIIGIPLGLGAGAVDSALNNFVALHFKARQMSWLHCFWGIGATLGPIIMSARIAKNGSWQNGYQVIAMLQICFVFILFLSLPIWRRFLDKKEEEVVVEEAAKNVFRLPGVSFSLLGFFSYCAIESTAGLWGASYLVLEKGVATDLAAGYISMYYLGITIGRFINGFVTKLSSKMLIRISQMIILSGAVLMIVSNHNYINLVGLILIGFGCAPIFPSMLHETPNRFGKNNSAKLMGIQMAFAYIGSTFVPPAFGLLSDQIGIQYYPIFILGFLILLVFGSEKINKIIGKVGSR